MAFPPYIKLFVEDDKKMTLHCQDNKLFLQDIVEVASKDESANISRKVNNMELLTSNNKDSIRLELF
jgi:hypothetical protein